MRPTERVLEALTAKGCSPRRVGDGWSARCPAHADRKPSLSIAEASDGRALVHCHAGCSTDDVLAPLGLERRDLFPDNDGADRRVVATYPYVDEDGKLLFEVVRFSPKGFRQRRPDGRGGWTYRLDGVRRVLYRLPEVLAAAREGREVWVVEGEKDADALVQAGLVATTNPGGAGKWKPEYSEALRGAHVVVVADRDEPGRAHARAVARALDGVVASVRVLEPSRGKDVAEHVATGGTLEDLVPLADEAAPERHRLLTAADLLRLDDEEEPDWLVAGLLPAGGLSTFVARPKVGKSTLARALAVAVVQGRPFLGRQVRQGPVLLISLEDRRRDVARHLRELGLRPEDPLFVATVADGMAEVEAWVRETAPVLVIVDTLARLVRVRDLNDYAEVTRRLDAVLALARTSGAHVLVLHHAPKGSDGRDAIDAPLGSTAIAGTVDVALHLKRAPDGTRTLASVQRHGDDMPESVLVLGADGWPELAGTKRELVQRELEAAIVAFLEGREAPASREEILEAVEGRAEAVRAALAALVEDGRVTQSGNGRRGDPYRFEANPDSVPPFPYISGNGGTETVPGGVSAGQAAWNSVPGLGNGNEIAGTESAVAGTETEVAEMENSPASGEHEAAPPATPTKGPDGPASASAGLPVIPGSELTGEEREALERVKAVLGAREVDT